MMTTSIAVALGLVAFASIFGLIVWVTRLYRAGSDRKQRILRAALAVAFIVSAGQVAAGDGGYAAAFPVIFGAWVLMICLVFAAWEGVVHRRAGHKSNPA